MRKPAVVFMVLVCAALSSASPQMSQKEKESSWGWLQELIPLPGVSGHEARVADYIQAALPGDLPVQRDDMDNLWFTVGEGDPHLVFVAHTDELGLVVEDITPEGRLTVSGRGGFVAQMYEGRPVVVFTKRGDVTGVVEPRRDYLKLGGGQQGLFDLNEALVYVGAATQDAVLEMGIRKGDFITIRKTISDLTPDLLATRAVDDRAGCAVLLAAAHRLSWGRVRGKTVTFAWDVQEETGLVGARRLAGQLGADYVFAVDTFVSTDAPLDDKRFARIPLGKGLVIRGMDSSTIAPRHLMERVMAVARKRGIPFHLGNTRGSTDGTRFIPEGAVSIPLSWPGTYSHSFIEKIHRKDLQALTDLVVALVVDFN